jgi:CRISPR-associated protein Csb2
MSPVKKRDDVFAFRNTDRRSTHINAGKASQAFRSAIMALVQTSLGSRVPLPIFFTGHEADGSPARRGGRTHLAFAFDANRQRLILISPHVMEAREPTKTEQKYLILLEQALSILTELRAGPVGLLKLEPVSYLRTPILSSVHRGHGLHRPTTDQQGTSNVRLKKRR